MPTVTVELGGALKAAAGGEGRYEVQANNVRQLLDALGRGHPELEPVLARGVAVAIDGQIFRDAWFEPIPEGAEVVLLPRLAGG